MRPATIIFVALSLLLITPVFTLFVSWGHLDPSLWQHLLNYTLLDVATNTLLLLILTATFACILGVGTAAVVTLTDFPARKLFHSLFLFPFVIPSYVLGFIYISAFDSSGLLQNYLRTFGIEIFINVRNIFILSIVFALALFPYVYLLCQQAFISQGRKMIECAKTLGHKPLGCFFLLSCQLPNLG
ncbi:MAG: hypothetical protein OYH77_00200 [Pseudomonadota bacterium]|nr:hypothetical protein [Pseudomonadota bacterium]